MAYEHLILEKRGHTALITINRPPANTWSLAAIEELDGILEKIEKENDTRVAVITGAGEKCFSAGMDVADAGQSPNIGARGLEVWCRVDRFEKPIIAAINGHALGGGFELALACHFRLMIDSPKARLGLPELNLGIIPGWGGTQRLYRMVGKARALDMILLSKRIKGQEAFDFGLVNQLLAPETFMDEVFKLADRLAGRPPIAVRAVLKSISAGIYEGMAAGLKTEEGESMRVSKTQDAKEGFTAFLENRPPAFKGE